MSSHIATATPTEADISHRYLHIELARIDLRIRRQVRRWQLADQDPSDAFRGLYITDAEVGGLLSQPIGGNWGQGIVLPAEEAKAFAKAEAQVARQAQALVQEAQGQTLRLMHLASAFGLDRFELDAFLICLAPALDLRYERLYGYLQDDVTRKQPRVNLILDLLSESGPPRLLRLSHFADSAPLFAHRLLECVSESASGRQSLLNQALVPDATVVSWLLGRYQPHGDVGPYMAFLEPEESKADILLAGGTDKCDNLWSCTALAASAAQQPIIAFYGSDQASQEAAARLCAARARRPLLAVNLVGVVQAGLAWPDAVRLTLRDARLTGAIPYLSGWDACLTASEDDTPSRDVLNELHAYSDLVIVAGRDVWQPTRVDRQRPLFWFEFPVPAYAQRSAIWRHFLNQPAVPAAAEDGLDISALASRFALTSGKIRDAVAAAGDRAAQANRLLLDHDLFAAARAYSNPRLASLARKIVPRYNWADIILPDDQLALLREIVDTVRGRAIVLDEWGIGAKLVSGTGVAVLFSGPPGTGKTMGAEIIAAELGLDLYKIDLSTIVSKYIGETEKNLERIFGEAQSSNAILFFDEADAIFGKRSEVKDAHDRYANIEISYLLQRMEIYDGVAILATNLRANLDEAFTRRLQFSVHFPFPEQKYRLRIWKTLFPPDVPRAPEIDFEMLAQRFRLAGGNIRNIIVGAAYLAAADGRLVTMKHLLHSTRRELQKMGRLVHEKDMIVG